MQLYSVHHFVHLMTIPEPIVILVIYFKHYSIAIPTRYIMVAGGIGIPPLRFLAEQVSLLTNTLIDFCFGAKNQESLILMKDLPKTPRLHLHVATNDGSKGYSGHVTDILSLLIKSTYNSSNQEVMVAICGPELMEKKSLDICNYYNVPCEISIERYIKCGVGICGQCAVDGPGICLCKEGPVVSREEANKIIEFGIYSRDNFGLKRFLKR